MAFLACQKNLVISFLCAGGGAPGKIGLNTCSLRGKILLLHLFPHNWVKINQKKKNMLKCGIFGLSKKMLVISFFWAVGGAPGKIGLNIYSLRGKIFILTLFPHNGVKLNQK